MRLSCLFTKVAWIVSLSALIVLQSCEGETVQPDVNTEHKPKPTVTISDVEVSASTVKFLLSTQNATRLKYSVVESGNQADYIEIFSSKEQSISLSKLDVGVEYTISACAYSREDVESEPAELIFTTENQTTYPRNMLATKFTGSWCGNCPYMTAALDDANAVLGDKIKIVALHYEMNGTLHKLECEGGLKLTSDWNISSYPTAILDYRESCATSSDDIVAIYNYAVKNFNATSDIAITSKVDGGVATIDVKGVVGASARYKIGAVITEDNIEVSGSDGSDDGFYHHVGREFLTDIYGDALDRLAKGDTFEKSFSCELSDDWSVDNLDVVVFIQKEESVNRYFTNNVKSVPINGNVDFASAN